MAPNNIVIERYTFITLFSRKFDQPPLCHVTLEWPPISYNTVNRPYIVTLFFRYFLSISYGALLLFSFYVCSALGSTMEMLNKQVKHNIHIRQVMFEYCLQCTQGQAHQYSPPPPHRHAVWLGRHSHNRHSTSPGLVLACSNNNQ